MEKFKPHFFTKATKDNKSDTGTLKAIRIANAVREQVDQNKENQESCHKQQLKQMIRSTDWKNKIRKTPT